MHGVANPRLNVCDGAAGRMLIPSSVELFGNGAELYDQVARQILRGELTPFFAPEASEILLIIAHDDAGIRAADKGPPVNGGELDDAMRRLGALG